MTATTDTPTSAAAVSVPTRTDSSQRRVLPPLAASISTERYEALTGINIRLSNNRYNRDAIESARRLWCQCPLFAHTTDREAVRCLARYLALEAVRVGGFNYKSAMRRANVERYLHTNAIRWTSRGARQQQYQLHEAGRVVHPSEYPRRKTLPAPHVKRQEAASHAKIRQWYALAPTLNTSDARRMQIVMDLCYGAGARAPDFKVLRGIDITEASWNSETVALVALPNITGGTRLVPVADPDISDRLLDQARRCGNGFLLATANGEVERNATNRTGEHLRARGHHGFTPTALRNRWVVDLAERIPAALLLQLADVKDLRVLADQDRQLPTYGIQQSIALLKENL